MNKRGFIKKLSERLNYTEDTCIIINDILENNFFISRKNRDKIIQELVSRLDVSEVEAANIYETAKTILNNEIKRKIKHPFGSQEK